MHSIIPAWKMFPFFRLLLPLISGILLQHYYPLDLYILLGVMGTGVLLVCLAVFMPISSQYIFRHYRGVILTLLLISLGCLLTWRQDARHDKNYFINYYRDSSTLLVRITEPPVYKEKSFLAQAEVETVISDGKMIHANGKIIISGVKNFSLKYGNRLLISKKPEQIHNRGNPGGFDFSKYQAARQVYYQVFLADTDAVILPGVYLAWGWQFIFRSRTYILEQLQYYLWKNKKIQGLAEALLIGYKQDLDPELVRAYRNTGVVHIIAISGLHLGLIYLLIHGLVLRLPGKLRKPWLSTIIVLCSLWLFALLTGAAASVLRSAVMFSAMHIGKTFFSRTSIYNTLASSAFILLSFNPMFLWDVGFQLSYLAVLGIVTLQQPLSRLLFFPNKWLNKFWKMVSLTLAAQLSTLPLCLYYFHQFPNYFLVANLLAVPMSTGILFSEIFLLVVSWVKIPGLVMGYLVSVQVSCMNAIILAINNWPGGLSRNISISAVMTGILYAFLILLVAGWQARKKLYIVVAIVLLVPFTLLKIWERIETLHQVRLVVYNIPQTTAIDFITGDKYAYRGDSIYGEKDQFYRQQLDQARLAFHARTGISAFNDLHYNQVWDYHGVRLLVLDAPVKKTISGKKIPVDILVISKNADIIMEDVLGAIAPAMVVFDSSNSLWKIAKWKRSCSALLLRFHSVPEEGAFIFTIKA